MLLGETSEDGHKTAQDFFARGDFVTAEALCRARVALEPLHALAHYNLGVVLARLDRFDEAIICCRRAIEIDPSFAKAYTNLGFCLSALNALAAARDAFDAARVWEPDNPVPVVNGALAALAMGDYAAGWPGLAARWRLPAYAAFEQHFDRPHWRGEDISGATLFLYAEQGFGDSIQMARFIPMLAAHGVKIIAEVQPALAGLFRGLAGGAHIVTPGEARPDFDFYCAMLDVPRFLNVTIETIPAASYLFAGAESLPSGGAPRIRPRIGLVWAGRASHENDRKRSLAFAQLAPLLALDGYEWIGLQRLVPEQDAAALAASPMLDWGQGLADFTATAAAMMSLDLVLSVDTAVAQQSGALGKKVWVLLPFYADWRWLTAREDSPWYPTARLFRQKKPGDWGEVIGRVGAALKAGV